MYERQALLIPDEMKEAHAIVVGCGMLGSWTIHSLVRTMRRVIAFDFDTVGRENIGTQAFSFSDETMNKAQAMTMHLQGLGYHAIPERLQTLTGAYMFGDDTLRTAARPHVWVSAVDSFDARRLVANKALEHNAALFIDTRAAGTVGVVCVVRPSDIPAYLSTLESDADAPEPQCGAEGTAFVGLWVASQVTSSIARCFRGLPVPYKVVHDVGMDLRVLTEMTAPKEDGVAV